MDYQHDGLPCTKCGAILDIATTADDTAPKAPYLKDGELRTSISICVRCRHIMAYDRTADDKLILRDMTLREAESIRGKEEIIEALRVILGYHRAADLFKGRPR